MLHPLVGFVADFPVRDDGDEPAGRALANFIRGTFTATGLCVSQPEDNGWGWKLRVTEGDLVAQTTISLVDDMDSSPPRQWLITNDCSLSFLRRLFGGVELVARRHLLLSRVCNAIHRAMRNDARFSHVLWYRAETFDKPGDVPGDQPEC